MNLRILGAAIAVLAVGGALTIHCAAGLRLVNRKGLRCVSYE